MSDTLFDDILPKLPDYLTRRDIKKHFGSLISPKYLANLDSAGIGPKKEIVCNKATYKKGDFIDWLRSRSKKI